MLTLCPACGTESTQRCQHCQRDDCTDFVCMAEECRVWVFSPEIRGAKND